MKRSGIFFASAVAASSAAFTSSDERQFRLLKPSDEALSAGNGSSSASQRNLAADKFAPRFDGLRFIETLITAHR
ncbi:unnamed protein product [Victoria cruziana]